jgi:hypothetical protein
MSATARRRLPTAVPSSAARSEALRAQSKEALVGLLEKLAARYPEVEARLDRLASILGRGCARAYSHAVDCLHALRDLDARVSDYGRLPAHTEPSRPPSEVRTDARSVSGIEFDRRHPRAGSVEPAASAERATAAAAGRERRAARQCWSAPDGGNAVAPSAVPPMTCRQCSSSDRMPWPARPSAPDATVEHQR